MKIRYVISWKVGLVDEIDNHYILNWNHHLRIIEIEPLMNQLQKDVVMIVQFSMNNLIPNYKIPPLAIERLHKTFSNKENYH